MPTLKQITASLELGSSGAKLKEYGHRYTDGGVEAFVTVPDTDVPFQVHIMSSGYIAPGLACYIYMDGEYQCNRNRQRLQIPAPGMASKEYEIDFNMRQREEKSADGLYVAREWTFAKLKTANADKAPNTNPHFSHNVGTIEVVILRCKDSSAGSMPSPTYSAIAPIGAPTARDFDTRSVRKSELGAPAKASSKPASKVASKAPSKAASKAPSKKASEAGSGGGGMFGGMMGLFDGAGDAPDYYGPRYRRPYEQDQYDPRPFTVHGGRNDAERARRFQQMPEYREQAEVTVNRQPDQYAPAGAYDFQQRRRAPLQQPFESPQPRMREAYGQAGYGRNDNGQRAQQRDALPDPGEPEGFDFVQDMCKQVEAVWRLSFAERQKATNLEQEVHQYRHDPELHLAAVKALRHRQQEIQNLSNEGGALLNSIFARMRRMNQASWTYCRDYLVLEKRLVPGNHPEVQQWPDPSMPQPTYHSGASESGRSRRSEVAPDDGWQQMGQGAAGGGLAQRKRSQQHDRAPQGSKAGSQNNGGNAWGASGNQDGGKDNNAGGWGAGDDIDQGGQINDAWGGGGGDNNNQGGDSWGNSGENKSRQAGGWDNKDDSGSKAQSAAAWGNSNAGKSGGGEGGDAWANNDNYAGNAGGGGDGGWGGENNDAGKSGVDGGGGWGEENNDAGKGGGDDAWGGGGADNKSKTKSAGNAWGDNQAQRQGNGGDWNDAKSQSHQSKVKSWKDSNQNKGKVNSGWGQRDDSRSRAHKSGHRYGGDSTNSERLEPIIKPYWAEWDQPKSAVQKPKVRARDPFEFPTPPTVIAPTEKPGSVGYGIQPGRGAMYTHNTYRPEYLDTMQKPYAIFTFKYRSKAALEKILNRRIDTSDAQRAIEEAEKERMMRMPKDEIVQEMMRLKVAAEKGRGGGGAGSRNAASNAGWGGGKADEKLKPSDSVSQRDWGARSDRGKKDEGWNNNKAPSNRCQGGAWNKAPSNKSQGGGGGWGNEANQDGNNGGGGGWGKEQSKQGSAKKSNGGGGGGWGADNGGGGGNDGWGGGGDAGGGAAGAWSAEKAPTEKTPELFAGDPGLQQAGSQAKSVPRDEGWEAAGWT